MPNEKGEILLKNDVIADTLNSSKKWCNSWYV